MEQKIELNEIILAMANLAKMTGCGAVVVKTECCGGTTIEIRKTFPQAPDNQNVASFLKTAEAPF